MRRTLVKLMTIVSRFDLPDRAVRRLSQMYLDASRAYPLAFREQMVELVRSGRTPIELAWEFEPTPQAIRRWVQIADERTDGLRSDEREEWRAIQDIRLRRQRVQKRTELRCQPAAMPRQAGNVLTRVLGTRTPPIQN